MFPGLTTKLSESQIAAATVIKPQTDLVNVVDTTATTTIATITPAFGGGFSGMIVLVNTSGNNLTVSAADNVAASRVVPNNMAVTFVYSKQTEKWYGGGIS